MQIESNEPSDIIEPDDEMQELNDYKQFLEKSQKNFWVKPQNEDLILDESTKSKKSDRKWIS